MPSQVSKTSYRKPTSFPTPIRDLDKAQASFHHRRSKALRSLARSSCRNGSQFAILLVNPSGDHVELYASEGLKEQLNPWFGKVREEAKETAQRYQHQRTFLEVAPSGKLYGPNGEVFDPGPGSDGATDDEDCGAADPPSEVHPAGGSNYDEFLPTPTRPPPPKPSGRPIPGPAVLSSSARITRSNSSTHLSTHQQPSPAASPATAASPASALSPAGPSSGPARSPTPHLPWQFTPESLATWYEGKFSDFNHKTDKVIAKAWIKAIEPHKQTRYPYREGDETRPAWWPTNVRHKEPDHLNKNERVALLIHIARFSPCSTDELDASLNNVASQLAIDKLAVAREVCRVAKEERLAVKRCGNGTFDSFSVTLGPIPAPPPPKKDEGDSETRHHNTRHRTRRSLGGNGTSDGLAPPSSRDHLPTPLQQTPRPSVRASPYPLSRSQSTSEMDPAYASPVRSPALGSSASAAGMSRSQSLAGPISSAGKPRAARQSGRHSLGEADLLDPSNAKGVSGLVAGADHQQSLQATPYRVAGGAGGRPQITPRQGQGSPLAGASMSRSYSTSAINGGGAGPTPGPAGGSASKVKASLIDDSVASPAMIKSRSRLSQQHFDSMGLGNGKAAKGGRGGAGAGGGGPPGVPHPQQPHQLQQQQQQQLPQPHFHPHHLQQFDPQHPPQRPPLPHSHTQPLPHGHPSHQHPQPHLVPHHPGAGQQPQDVLVYHPGASAPTLVRQPSSGGQPINIHPSHQLQLQQSLNAQAQQHLQQHHQHHFAAGQQPNSSHHHQPTQVQVQVNVHAAHSLPPPPQEYEQHLPPLPPPHQQQQHMQQHPSSHSHSHHPHPHGQRQPSHPQHLAQQGGAQYAAYPTPQSASTFGASPSPFIAQQQQHPGGSPYLDAAGFAPSQGDAFLMSSSVDAALYAGGGAPSPSLVGDGYSQHGGGGSMYGASPAPLSATTGDGDLSMYVQQLEMLEAQQGVGGGVGVGVGQGGGGGAGGGGGFEDALGLGLGMGGMSMGGMGLEEGYYGEDGFGAVGA